MTPETLSEKSERLSVELTAEEYRRKGYQVYREPRLDFLRGFVPDLVVEKNGEKKVIEVKSRSSMIGNDHIVEMAKLVYAQPGWTFDLHMIGEPEAMQTPSSAKSFDLDDIVDRLTEAERLRHSDAYETAYMIAWVACEAAVRELLALYGVKNERITTATHLLDQAAYHGAISRADYFRLYDAAELRNAFVHGYKVAEFETGLVDDLIATARNILDAIAKGPCTDEDDELPDVWPVGLSDSRSP